MTSTIPARPTTYKGIQMRSRLEALYAWWLDQCMEVPHWEYEPRAYAGDAGQYLPDFVFQVPQYPGRNFYAEVKPLIADHAAALRRMHVVLESDPTANLLVVTNHGGYGTWPDLGPIFYPSPAACSPENPCGHCPRSDIW